MLLFGVNKLYHKSSEMYSFLYYTKTESFAYPFGLPGVARFAGLPSSHRKFCEFRGFQILGTVRSLEFAIAQPLVNENISVFQSVQRLDTICSPVTKQEKTIAAYFHFMLRHNDCRQTVDSTV